MKLIKLSFQGFRILQEINLFALMFKFINKKGKMSCQFQGDFYC